MKQNHRQNYTFDNNHALNRVSIFGLNPKNWMQILAQAVLAKRVEINYS